jgi:hypothetical protein
MLKQVGNAAQNVARKAATSITEKANEVAPVKTAAMSAKLNAAQNVARNAASSITEKANEKIKEVKEAGGNFAVEKLHNLTASLRQRIEPKLCDALGSDPDMPGPVKQGINVIVDEIMDEVEVAVNDMVEAKIKGTTSMMKNKMTAEPYPCCCPNPFLWLRALVLYTLFPHDKSIWANLRSPLWWLIKIISIFPYYYINTIFWVVVWLIKSKRDEYQLVNFIVELKKAHFISYGVLGSLIGNYAFLQCAIIHPHQNPNTYVHKGGMNDTQPSLPCASSAPGLSLPFWPTATIFATQILLTWASAALIPCSQRLGERNQDWLKKAEERRLARRKQLQDQGKADLAKKEYDLDKNKSTRRLKYWLIYDAVCCVLILVLCVLAALDSKAVEKGPSNIPTFLQIVLWWYVVYIVVERFSFSFLPF